MTNTQKENLEKLLNKQKSVKITLGSIMGLLLIIFFYSYGAFIDKAPGYFFTIELILTCIIVPSLFMLNRISFAWIKMTRGKKPEFKDIIAKLEAGDVDKKIDLVLQKIQ